MIKITETDINKTLSILSVYVRTTLKIVYKFRIDIVIAIQRDIMNTLVICQVYFGRHYDEKCHILYSELQFMEKDARIIYI